MSEMGRSLGVRKQAVLQTFLDSWGRGYLLREPNERIECGRCGKQFSCDQDDVGAPSPVVDHPGPDVQQPR